MKHQHILSDPSCPNDPHEQTSLLKLKRADAKFLLLLDNTTKQTKIAQRFRRRKRFDAINHALIYYAGVL